MAEYIYDHRISPTPPVTINEFAKDYVNTSWASETNDGGNMTFKWKTDNKIKCSTTSEYVFGLRGSDYYSGCLVDKSGMWRIYYTEYDEDDKLIGGGGNNYYPFSVIDAPDFSSYSFALISLIFTYIILRKKYI